MATPWRSRRASDAAAVYGAAGGGAGDERVDGPAAVAQLALARPRSLSFAELRAALGGTDTAHLADACGAHSAPAKSSYRPRRRAT